MGLPRVGGVGGKGGDVFVVADEKESLDSFKSKYPSKRFFAEVGVNSSKRYVLGEPGKDLHVPVPVGITVLTDQGRSLGDLNQPKDTVLVARGGAGGCPQNQYSGQKGQTHSITLDLKLIADIGLVGFPNAGKSTLLTAVSRASPKIASYPFTTIRPELGMLDYEDYRRICMADLPGLIEGAHYNIGMGHKFLKHVERTKMLLFVVDVNGFQLSHKYPFRTAFETTILLNKELELYKEALLDKPALLAVNKMDSPEAEEKLEELVAKLSTMKDSVQNIPNEMRPDRLVEFDEIIPISAKLGIGIDHLRSRVRQLLDVYADMELERLECEKNAS